jgi:integrase
MGSSSAYIRRADVQKYLTEIEAAKLKGTWVDPKQSPCRGVPLPKVEHEEMRYLNPAEIADLADKIHPAFRALVFVGVYGGLRIGELAALRRSCVDFAAATVDAAETVNELKGKLVVGPPKARTSRRKVSHSKASNGGAGHRHPPPLQRPAPPHRPGAGPPPPTDPTDTTSGPILLPDTALAPPIGGSGSPHSRRLRRGREAPWWPHRARR